jgi:hypothetical protein
LLDAKAVEERNEAGSRKGLECYAALMQLL